MAGDNLNYRQDETGKDEVDLTDLPVTPTNTAIKNLISDRKLTPEVVDVFDISISGEGWIYPTPAGGTHWKNFDSAAPDKYKWPYGKLADDNLYFAPDILEAVNQSGGVVWMVSGPPDVWALRAAKIPHAVSCLSSETSVPAALADLLRSLGVVLVYIAPDLDKTGERWANLIAARLAGSGIELKGRELIADLGNGGDLGKLWASYRGRIPFEEYVKDFPKLTPEIETPKEIQEIIFKGGDLHPVYRRLITQAFKVDRFDAKGYSKPILCPFHDDHRPSAALHELKGLHCFTCCGWVTWTKLGEAMGFGAYRPWLKLHNPQPQTYAGDPGQLSIEARQTLIKSKLTTLARVLDALYMAGWQAGREFTAAEAVKAVSMFGVSRRTVYNVLKDNKSNVCTICPVRYAIKNKGDNTYTHSNWRGPVRVFVLSSPGEVNKILSVSGVGVELPETCLDNSADYRAAVYASIPIARPGAYTRKMLAEPLGLSDRTTRRYDRREHTGLVVIARHGRSEPITPELAERLPDERKDFPPMVWLEDKDGKKYPPMRTAALGAIERGKRLTFVWRGANYYGPSQPRITPRAKMPRVLEDWIKENGGF